MIDWLFDLYRWEKSPLVAAILLLASSILLYRRLRGLAALFQLIGSSAYVGMNAIDVFLYYMASYKMAHENSSFAWAIFPTCTPDPWFGYAKWGLMAVSLCFPAGFMWFAFQTHRAPGQPVLGATT